MTTTKTKTTEIKLIQNKSEGYFRVIIDGKDGYTNFSYSDNFNDENNEMNMRRLAKACAFDECLRAAQDGRILVSYISY